MTGNASSAASARHVGPIVTTGAAWMLCVLSLVEGAWGASTEDKPKPKLPIVLFFITHSTPDPCRPGPYIEQGIKDANQELIRGSKGAKGMEPVIRIVFDKKDVERAALQAITEFRLERKVHYRRKIRGVFLDCEWEMGDPKHRRDRARSGELQRLQVDLDVECEFCRLWVQTDDRLHKRHPWKKKLKVDYLTPRTKIGERAAWTGEDAIRLAAGEIVGKLFAMRDKWLK